MGRRGWGEEKSVYFNEQTIDGLCAVLRVLQKSSIHFIAIATLAVPFLHFHSDTDNGTDDRKYKGIECKASQFPLTVKRKTEKKKTQNFLSENFPKLQGKGENYRRASRTTDLGFRILSENLHCW